MTQLPNAMGGIPAGVDPTDYLNWLAQMQAYQQQGSMDQSSSQNNALMELLKNAQSQQLNANNANDSRYMDILQLLGINRKDIMGKVDQFGQSLVNDTNRTYKTSLNNQLGDLASRGLSGSSIRSSVTNANTREKSAALTRVKDSLLNNQINQLSGTLNPITGLMERRNDVQPDMNSVTDLVYRLGQSGGGPGNGGVGNRQQPGIPQTPQGGYGAMSAPPQMPTVNRGAPIAQQAIGGGSAPSIPGSRYAGGPPMLRKQVPTPDQIHTMALADARQRNLVGQQALAAQDKANYQQGLRYGHNVIGYQGFGSPGEADIMQSGYRAMPIGARGGVMPAGQFQNPAAQLGNIWNQWMNQTPRYPTIPSPTLGTPRYNNTGPRQPQFNYSLTQPGQDRNAMPYAPAPTGYVGDVNYNPYAMFA